MKTTVLAEKYMQQKICAYILLGKTKLSHKVQGGYFKVFILWLCGRVAGNKTLPYFNRGSVAANAFLQKIF